MIRFPRGSITFLCAAIEAPSLGRRADQLRTAITEQRGMIFYADHTTLYAAFSGSLPALEATLQAYRTMHPSGADQHQHQAVSIVLHTGPAFERDGVYFGPTLTRAISMLAAAHPGQILVSATVHDHDMVQQQLPADLRFHDLGEYRLKDLFRTAHLYQLQLPGMPATFPPLRSLDLRPHNLPIQDSPLIGREQEVATASALLRLPTTRLLTLVGSSGLGKTRLALQVAVELIDEAAEGVWFVALAPVSDPSLLISMIAQVLEIKEQSGHPLIETLAAALQTRHLLLVLDNFEQILASAAAISDLLASTQQVKILVTSQVALGLDQEQVFVLPPLAMPDPTQRISLAALSQIPAVALFVERAHEAHPAFLLTEAMAPAVIELCTCLEGLPLALELVAAQSKRYFPSDMLMMLKNRLSVARTIRRGNTREDTLSPVLDWICEVLGADVAGFFARLGVFAGGCTGESAKAICNPSNDLGLDVDQTLGVLLGNHLLLREELKEGHVRYTMLDAIHDYAQQRLSRRREATRLHTAHASYYTQLAETAEPLLKGAEQKAWLARLEDEHHNLRAALRWSRTNHPDQTLQLSAALARFWFVRGHFSEGRQWLDAALEQGAIASPAIHARAFHGVGLLAYAQSDYDQAVSAYQASLDLRRSIGDSAGVAMMLNNLGIIAQLRGDYPQATRLYEDCLPLSREVGDSWAIANTLSNLGGIAFAQTDFARAASYYQESLAVREQLGDTWGLCLMLFSLGDVAYYQSDYHRAQELLAQSLTLAEQLDDTIMRTHILDIIALTNIAQGNLPGARRLLVESVRIRQELGATYTLIASLELFAGLRLAEGQVLDAPRLLGAAAQLRDKLGTPLSPVEQRQIATTTTTSLAQISQADYDRAWQAGWNTPLNDLLSHLLTSPVA